MDTSRVFDRHHGTGIGRSDALDSRAVTDL
jgi:hypothetical protein